MTPAARSRIAYIDWLRGLACAIMFETHGYDSWLKPAARQGRFFQYSQLGGTLPAPLFLFLAGLSLALAIDRSHERGLSAATIGRGTVRRGAEIFLLALLFRLQEWLLSWFHAPWTDLLRVDILNVIGITIVLMAAMCCIVGSAGERNDTARERLRAWYVLAASGVTAAIALATPPLWTTMRPTWLPWYLESYVNGVHIYGVPQPWLFPIFPWAAFGFAGVAAGFLLSGARAQDRELTAVALFGVAGVAMFAAGWWLDSLPVRLYAAYDFWHTSPNWFLMRLGLMFVTVFLGYAWCRWGAGEIGFSPFVKLGQASLLVYWVHLEFVYGSLSIMHKRAESIGHATIGIAIIFTAMTLLAIARSKFKGRGADIAALFRRPAQKSS